LVTLLRITKSRRTPCRSFYEQEAIQNNWSVRELKRQINSMLFERIALSKDTKAVMKMAEKGQIIEKPEDAIKDSYILEFLNLADKRLRFIWPKLSSAHRIHADVR
jgi:predicted nuclease of restriction endonuclease-like (RecB) superfamily